MKSALSPIFSNVDFASECQVILKKIMKTEILLLNIK